MRSLTSVRRRLQSRPARFGRPSVESRGIELIAHDLGIFRVAQSRVEWNVLMHPYEEFVTHKSQTIRYWERRYPNPRMPSYLAMEEREGL